MEDFCVSIASWKRNVGRVEVKNLLTKKEENLEVEDEEEEEGKVFWFFSNGGKRAKEEKKGFVFGSGGFFFIKLKLFPCVGDLWIDFSLRWEKEAKKKKKIKTWEDSNLPRVCLKCKRNKKKQEK